MKKRLLSMLVTMAMLLTMLPAIPALAADGDALLTIYYTNDVHTYIDGSKGLTYSQVAQMKADKAAAGENVLLVDAGDHIQGTAYGGMDKGATIVKLMNASGYDLATFGNHEFDYGMQGALDTVANANYPYVSANFVQDTDGDGTWEAVANSYKIFEFDGKKIAIVGITTPETFTKSTPAYFQDGNGKYIYDIYGRTGGQDLYDSVQKAIDAAKAEGADMVIALGHLGVDPSSTPWTSEELIANVSGLSAFIDGHSHSTVPSQEVKDKDGKTVILSQTGSYLAAVGEMKIAADGTVSTSLINSYDGVDESVKAIEDAWIAEVDNKLGTPIAESDIDFKINYFKTRFIRTYETNLGDLDADAYYYYINEVANLDCDVAVTNGGGVRADVDAGTWTYKTAKTVNTFGNVLCLMKVPGQMILDALEWGAKDTPKGENGGFLHVAGLTYKINTNIPETIVRREDNAKVWAGAPTGEYRVYDVKVYNKETKAYEPLDVTKTYTLGGCNYTLRQQGDGFDMFQEADGMELVMEGISEDYLALSAYVAAFTDTDDNGLGNIATANSPLASYENYLLDYENVLGSGRIENANTTIAMINALPVDGSLITAKDNYVLSAFKASFLDMNEAYLDLASQLRDANAALADKDAELSSALYELNDTKDELSKTQKELKSTKAALAKAEKELATLKAKNRTVTSLKISVKNKKITVSWKKTSGATGYQVSYKLKTAKSYKTLTTTKNLKATTKALTKGKVYQFKVRAYTTVNGSKVYGKYTSVKSVTCK